MALAEYEDFQALAGRAVLLRAGQHELAGRIESVRPLPEHPGQPRRPFSVTIVTEQTGALPQQMFSVEIEAAGTDASEADHEGTDDESETRHAMELFLVPIGPSGGGMAYEAVFA